MPQNISDLATHKSIFADSIVEVNGSTVIVEAISIESGMRFLIFKVKLVFAKLK